MTHVTELIRREIARDGAIPFARFMELALYAPDAGYYERAVIGRRGDFFTSVSTGRMFGELLAVQFAEWLDALPETGSPPQIVEAGAHGGELAFDILNWLREHRPDRLDRLEYWILEPSSRRQEHQRTKLAEFAPRIRWWSGWDALRTRAVRGVIFSNELLDALPVHRLGWDATARRWFEWGATLRNGEFHWTRLTDEWARWPNELAAAGFELPENLLAVLPDAYTLEVSPAAGRWWRSAARALDLGRLLTLDYGLTAAELLSATRTEGTLRAYFRHQATRDLLARPGEQDLTAHVNFTQLQRAGEAEGLVTDACTSQARWLTEIFSKWHERSKGEGGPGMADLESPCVPSSDKSRQFLTLIHPDHLGERFRVMIQSRD